MKKAELEHIVTTACKSVIEKNREIVRERVKDAFKASEGSSVIPTGDAIASAAALCLTLAPELSAAITGRILVDLGIVSLEDDE